MKIGNKNFDTDANTYVMGILNVTPDSFFDGGKHNDHSQALSWAQKLVDDGADIIDVGGESTRPGYKQITEEEEIDRVASVISAIKRRLDIPVSIDTYKSRVALAAIEAGADMVNDIWGLKYDENMAAVIAQSGLPCVLMHNKDDSVYTDFFAELYDGLNAIALSARLAGIDKSKIVLDPGIGFGKTKQHNLSCIANTAALNKLGYPILIGASNKSVVGAVLSLPADQRLSGTLAVTAIAATQNAAFVRVHNVLESKRVIAMVKAVMSQQI